MKQSLEKSMPAAKCFDHDLNETLNKIGDIEVDDENELITASDNFDDFYPSQPHRVPKTRKVKPMIVPFPPSCSKCYCRVSDSECQKHVRSLEKKCQKEASKRKPIIDREIKRETKLARK